MSDVEDVKKEPILSQAERDTQHLASLGYTQELQRTLGLFSNFAVAFSYISVSTGTFALFALGISTGGPAFFWSWPLVALGQFLVAFNFAELASHYPVTGSIYQWSKRLASPGVGWMMGWFYLAATLLTVTAVSFSLPQSLAPIFNWPVDPPTEVKIALGAIVISTALNISGVRLLSLINNVGVVAEIVGMGLFALILLIVGHHQPLGVFANTGGTGSDGAYVGVFLTAMFMSLFVIYGFDTAGSLGEETINPTREAPRGMLWALGLSCLAGFLFIGGAILAIKDVPAIMKSAAPLPDIITGALGTFWGNAYLVIVSIAIFVCALSVQAAATRLIFSMSRDDRLPLARVWASVHPTFGTPVWTALLVGVLGALPLIVSQQIGVITTGAAGLIYLSYTLTDIVLLRARRRGWPQGRAPFSLGRWGLPINVLAVIWGCAMLANFAWPRALTNPSVGLIPIFELTVIVLLVVGGAYWLGVQRHRGAAPGIVSVPAHGRDSEPGRTR